MLMILSDFHNPGSRYYAPLLLMRKPKLRLINLPEVSAASIAEGRLRILEAVYHL